MPAILDKLLRIGEGKIIRQLESIVAAVNAIEDDFVAMSDAELQGMTDEFKKRLADGESLDDLMPEAFATARERERFIANSVRPALRRLQAKGLVEPLGTMRPGAGARWWRMKSTGLTLQELAATAFATSPRGDAVCLLTTPSAVVPSLG